ncbi:HhH-GPD domain [Dillenia turbinata]|uniref:HhH-GPD domain n=1 Tax=Dillenia turbinata TaxID=194707 RepID=A0AAN8UYR6_9MAGN
MYQQNEATISVTGENSQNPPSRTQRTRKNFSVGSSSLRSSSNAKSRRKRNHAPAHAPSVTTVTFSPTIIRPLSIDGELQFALQYLRNSDPALAKLIDTFPPPKFDPFTHPFVALSKSLIFQQLSYNVGTQTYIRFVSLCGGKESGILPDTVLGLDPEELRKIGISTIKVDYLKDLAEKYESGIFSDSQILSMDDHSLCTMLNMVKGIGPWSVYMFMIFSLHRPDVLPINDIGVRKGVQLLHNLSQLPRPSEMEKLCAKWKPYRSVASCYLWKFVKSKDEGGVTEIPAVGADDYLQIQAVSRVSLSHLPKSFCSAVALLAGPQLPFLSGQALSALFTNLVSFWFTWRERYFYLRNGRANPSHHSPAVTGKDSQTPPPRPRRTRESSGSESSEGPSNVKSRRKQDPATAPPPTVTFSPTNIRPLSFEDELERALQHLHSSDRALAKLIDTFQPPKLENFTLPFVALSKSLISQQLSYERGIQTYNRFVSLRGGEESGVLPNIVLGLDTEKLREIGVSMKKAEYLKDLANKYKKGILSDDKILAMDDNSLRNMLNMVKGIRPLLVHTFMIFCLHRPDVFPIHDMGVRKCVQYLYDLPVLPRSCQMEKLCAKWKPYRSVASCFLWKLAESQDAGVVTEIPAVGADDCLHEQVQEQVQEQELQHFEQELQLVPQVWQQQQQFFEDFVDLG